MTEKMLDPVELRRSTRRWQVAGVWVFLILVLSFPAYRFTENARLDTALASQTRAQIATGKHLWALNCAECHGINGEGVDAPALNSQQFLGAVSDNQIQGIIAGGIPGTAMPVWLADDGGPLTQQQINALVAYIRSWQPHAPSNPNWRTPTGATGATGAMGASGSMGAGG